MDFVRLSELPKGVPAIVMQVDDADSQQPDVIAQRLRDLGFVAGEPIRVIARGPLGGDPILVQIGSTRFALRLSEARRVAVNALQVAS